jgi:hypothetical protein
MAVAVQPQAMDARLRALAEAAIRLQVATVAVPRTAVVADRMVVAGRTAAVAADMGGKIALVSFPA